MSFYTNENALFSLIKRITPGYENAFDISFIPSGDVFPENRDYFEIEASPDRKIILRGRRTGALAAAYGWYLKHIVQVHLSWCGDRMALPASLPLPQEKIVQSSPWKYRYAYNYCALSYTMAFYNWEEWERELDFLALNGFTHVLVTAGLEKVWQEVLNELGYPPERIKAFIPNPAYAAWWNLGNLEGLGGPMTQGLIEREARLGAKIVRRIREMGMIPVIQGFTGLVPHDVKDYFPELPVFPQGKWLNEFQRPALLDPRSPAFKDWADVWYRHLHRLYGGPAGAYSGDLFHEGGNYEKVDLPATATCIQQTMQEVSPRCCWIIQSWRDNPLPELVKGLDREHTLVLELWKDLSEGQMTSDTLRTYAGCPWAWCEVTNFGGNHDLYGGLSFTSELPSWLLHHPNREGVCGLGLLSEGLGTNPIQYDLFLDLFWKEENIDLDQWLNEYVIRRYGKPDRRLREALGLLAASVYDVQHQQEGSTESILCAKPSLRAAKVSNWASDQVYYHPLQVIQAAGCMLQAAGDLQAEETYRYDLVDVIRQMIADMARPVLAEIRRAFIEKEVTAFEEYSGLFLGLFDDVDKLLASDSHWLLAGWLEDAKGKGKTRAEKSLMEKAARMLITTWSGSIDLLDEYSNRQWAGLMRDYYKPRWEMFLEICRKAVTKHIPLDALEDSYMQHLQQADLAFEHRRDRYAASPGGDTVRIAGELFNKYSAEASALWKKHAELVNIV